MLQVIIRLIGVLMLLAGVILVYDARIITKKVYKWLQNFGCNTCNGWWIDSFLLLGNYLF